MHNETWRLILGALQIKKTAFRQKTLNIGSLKARRLAIRQFFNNQIHLYLR
ncbi:hypothetical protein PGR6_51010 [Pseudomonas sp. GR 6-02]|nr:hypothetical protein PGR6_51010 [Pseudomonas sp. GR 6-02]